MKTSPRSTRHYPIFPSNILIFSLFFLMALGTFIVLTSSARANEHWSGACDHDYWDSLTRKAWQEAQREVEANALYIWKPDSVLELTCFDGMGDHAAQYIGELFSDIDREDALGDALTDAVGASLETYTTSAGFAFPFAGGRGDGGSTISSGASTSGLGDYEVDDDMHNGSYPDCENMYRLWMFAMCQNQMRKEHFMTFLDLAVSHDYDLRDYPEECDAADPDTVSMWEEDNELTFTMTARDEYGDEFFDPIINFYEVTEPVGSPFFDGCDKGEIETGVEVISPDGVYDELFCANPGCHPADGGGSCTE